MATMPEAPDHDPDRRPPSRPEPFALWQFWGRETVKDAVLLLIAIVPLAGLILVPLGLQTGRWWPPLLFVVGGIALWWLARRVLRAWVARGESATERT